MNTDATQEVQVETPEDIGPGQEGQRKRWLAELAIAEKNDRAWRNRADKVLKRYRDERDAVERTESKMNLLWSNTKTIMPALYANTPNPMVDRRNKQKDPVGLMAARILEGASEYAVDCFDFDGIMEAAVEDYQLPGRAVARVFYRPSFKDERVNAEPISYEKDYMANLMDPDSPIEIQGEPVYDEGVEFDDDGAFTMEEQLDYEEVEATYVYWKDFRMGKAKSWKAVPWVGFRSYLTKDEVTERFGADRAAKCSYKHRPDEQEHAQAAIEDGAELLMKTEVWEIWDKVAKKVIWVSKDYPDGLLDSSDPHLKLKGFYPCTEPLIMTKTTGTMIPVPEFCQYQDQADQIDNLTNRIDILTDALRVTGVYDQGCEGLGKILASSESDENKLYPIANWAQYMDKGGLEKAIGWLPIDQIVAALIQLIDKREVLIQMVYQITGIADIIRGSSDAQETAAAQKIKGRFASMRLRDKQKLIARFARDIVRLTAEVMSENFSKETLQAMTGIRYEKEVQQQPEQQAAMGGGMAPPQAPGMGQQPEPGMMPPQGMPPMQPPPPDPQQVKAMEDAQNEAMWDQVMDLLRNDPLRQFRIAIETDSTIQPDEEEEKRSRTEFLEATGTFMQGAIMLGQQMPELTPLITEMLMFGVRGFRAGRELEERFEDVMDQINAKASQPQQPQPNPEMIKAQIEQQKAQAKIQQDQASAAIKQKQDQQKMVFDQQQHAQEMKQATDKFNLEMIQMERKGERELQLMDRKQQFTERVAMNKAAAENAPRETPEAPAAPAQGPVNITMPEIEMPDITVNVDANGPKKITLNKDADGNITGGESA